jgi:hypothetical protein
MARVLRLDDGTEVAVDVVEATGMGGGWVAGVAAHEAADWAVTVAEGDDAEDALSALRVTLHRFGRRASSD